jgi:hypothetical protein
MIVNEVGQWTFKGSKTFDYSLAVAVKMLSVRRSFFFGLCVSQNGVVSDFSFGAQEKQ